jgi:hypothetical protein
LHFFAGDYTQSISSYYNVTGVNYVEGTLISGSRATTFITSYNSTSNGYFSFPSTAAQLGFSDLVIFFTYRFAYFGGYPHNISKINFTNVQIQTNSSS